MKAVRSVFFWLHLIAGCLAAVAIFIMSVTGVVLAYENQIVEWASRPVVESLPAGAVPASIEAIIAGLNTGSQSPSQLVLHSDPKQALEARYGRQRTVYVSPATGDVIGQPSEGARQFFSLMTQWHRSLGLGMQNAIGRGIADAGNLIFLFLVVSGLYLWLPNIWKANAVKARALFRGRLKGRARDWNWHHVIGIWCLIPLFFVVLTGVIISYPWASNLLYTMTGSPIPVRGGPGGPGGPGGQGGPGGPGGQQRGEGVAQGGEQRGQASQQPQQAPAQGEVQHGQRGGHGQGAPEGQHGPGGQDRQQVSEQGEGQRGQRGEGGPGGQHGPSGQQPQQASAPVEGQRGPVRPQAQAVPAPKAQAAVAKKPSEPAPPPAPVFKSIDELVGVAKAQAPDWKTISFDIPTAQQKTVNFTVNTSSSGGQVSNTQLVVNRETGSLQPTRGNASTSLGQKLRMWARFLHTGEQFGVIGETIALLATLGGIFLVWTGISLAIWRVMTAWRRSIDPDTKRGPSVEEEAESAS